MSFLGLTMPSLVFRVSDPTAERPGQDCKPRLKLASVARSDFGDAEFKSHSDPDRPQKELLPWLESFARHGNHHLTGRCSELSGGIMFSNHHINFRQPVR